jgi:CubicO group peptidase (beta-lactamase class C family)
MIELFNKHEIHQSIIPAGNGIGTARGLARFYGMWSMLGKLDDVQILYPSTVRGVTAIQREGIDLGSTSPQGEEKYRKIALGLMVDDPSMGKPENPNTHTFGHGGAGSSIGWADTGSQLGVAIVTNGCQTDPVNADRLTELSQAVRDACA